MPCSRISTLTAVSLLVTCLAPQAPALVGAKPLPQGDQGSGFDLTQKPRIPFPGSQYPQYPPKQQKSGSTPSQGDQSDQYPNQSEGETSTSPTGGEEHPSQGGYSPPPQGDQNDQDKTQRKQQYQDWKQSWDQTWEKNRQEREQQERERQNKTPAAPGYSSPQQTPAPYSPTYQKSPGSASSKPYKYPPKNKYTPPIPKHQKSSSPSQEDRGTSQQPESNQSPEQTQQYPPQTSPQSETGSTGGTSDTAGNTTTPSSGGDKACKENTEHTYCTSNSPEYHDDEEFKAQILNSTNTYRKMYKAPEVQWDDSLAQFGNAHAAKCLFQHTVEQGLQNPNGENLGLNYNSPQSMVDAFAGEVKDYNFANPGFSMATGHFTQLVWKDTKKVGCGKQWCDGKGWLVFCEYYPPGNSVDPQVCRENVADPNSSG